MLLKKSGIHFYLISFLLVTLNFQGNQKTFNKSVPAEVSDSNILDCPNACQVSDSLALVALYNATAGSGWVTGWNLNQPVCTPWSGVELDASGYVITIQLSGNNLTGTLPLEIGNFSRLSSLQLDNNNISGNIPAEVGNLSELTILFLDNNDFTGTLPSSFGNLDQLEILYLDNNDLSGAIPQSFTNLVFLQKLDIFNNAFDSLPDMSGINIQPNKFRIFNNNFTFDDILPNSPAALGDNYFPQDSVFETTTVFLNTGTTYTIDLGFDSGILDNSYKWYRNGVPYGAPLSINELTFSPVGWNTAGMYNCTITNPNASQLSLYSRTVNVVVSCGTSVYELTDDFCTNESIVLNGTLYDQNNPSGSEFLPGMDQYGCDSIIEVNLTFFPVAESYIIESFCNNESIVVNGTTYNQSNPNGMEIFPNASVHGCDSIVFIDLTYNPVLTENLNLSLCSGESIVVNGTTYDENNPSGSEFMPGGSVNGCDSTTIVELDFFPVAEYNLNPTLCFGQSINVNGTIYNQANPTGTEILQNANVNGCDSTVFISLSFYPEFTETLNQTLCHGESVIINGTTYNQNNPQGTEVLSGASAVGCDSTVIIDLEFFDEIIYNFDPTLCFGEAVTINGTLYNQTNPNGSELFENGSLAGCDSTVLVSLSFYDEIIVSLNNTLCNNESITVNGTVYNQTNPSGTEFMPNGSFYGCDSTVNINLSFIPAPVSNFTSTICANESILINGTTYDILNPSGTEVIDNAAVNGCDSIVFISLDFHAPSLSTFSPVFCAEESILINNTLYNFSNPTGIEVLQNADVNNCDSTVFVDISFYDPISTYIVETLCEGEEIEVNNTIYNENNSSGIEVVSGAGQMGCDSTIFVNLEYYVPAEGYFVQPICEGDQVVINGTIYDQNNPSGIEIFSGMSSNGCDSTLFINLNFYAPAEYLLSTTLCDGEIVVINGNAYSQTNPNGVEVLENASVNGCDSTITIQLAFYDIAFNDLTTTLCDGDFLQINGTIYNASNPAGMEILENASYMGCDSSIQIDLSFYPPVFENITESICEGATFEIGNNSFSTAGNYMVTLENASVQGCDSTVHLDLMVITDKMLGLADAGEDFALCDGAHSTVEANLPSGTSGLWTTNSGAVIASPNDFATEVSNLSPGNNSFVWTLSSDQCPDYHADEIIIYVEEVPQAANDNFTFPYNSVSNELDLIQNDQFSIHADWFFEIMSFPAHGTLDETGEGIYKYSTESNFTGIVDFQYQLCSEKCPELCTSAIVQIMVDPPNFGTDIPNGITPNGDGVNETFIFPQLESNPEQYPDRELIIFNRWGDIVYQAKPYQNDWRGQNKNGQPLPSSTYYYVLRLDIGEGYILKGDVTILK